MTKNNNPEKFIKYLEDIDIKLSDRQINSFFHYYEMLVTKNEVMNLTSITDFDEVIIKHFIDSLCIVKAYDKTELQNNTLCVLDVGTGAGFPGIPLKIAFPKINITLLDSLNKRVEFLNEVINELGLNEEGHITAVHSRAEDYIKEPGIRESFDIVVSRAVSNLSVLSEYCIPYVKKEGYFLPYKSAAAEEEIKNSEKALSILGGITEENISFILPGTADVQRNIIKIKKIKETPLKYPRKAGVPLKKPL